MAGSTTPQAGIGITLGQGTSSSGPFTGFGELKDDCEFEGFDTTIIPVPVLASTSVPKTSGRTDFGSFNGSLYLLPAETTTASMITLATNKTLTWWQVQLPDGSTGTTGSKFVFQGIVNNIKPGNFTGEDAPTLDFSIAISGAVTMTAAT